MQQPSPSYRESYQAATVSDAARILGVSESTIRRLVRTGKLEAERVERPQGHAWLVKIPAPATDQSGTSHHLNQSQGGIYMVGLLEDGVDDRSKGVGLSL
jgi:excisionase family DNA binding protein